MTNLQIRIRPDRCGAQGEKGLELSIDDRTRYEVDNVEGRLGTFARVSVINISLEGVAIETPEYLEVGRNYPLTFKRSTGLLCLQANVVWSRLGAARCRPRPVLASRFVGAFPVAFVGVGPTAGRAVSD